MQRELSAMRTLADTLRDAVSAQRVPVENADVSQRLSVRFLQFPCKQLFWGVIVCSFGAMGQNIEALLMNLNAQQQSPAANTT